MATSFIASVVDAPRASGLLFRQRDNDAASLGTGRRIVILGWLGVAGGGRVKRER